VDLPPLGTSRSAATQLGYTRAIQRRLASLKARAQELSGCEHCHSTVWQVEQADPVIFLCADCGALFRVEEDLSRRTILGPQTQPAKRYFLGEGAAA
jgi:ribosomal protein L37AE/L43A